MATKIDSEEYKNSLESTFCAVNVHQCKGSQTGKKELIYGAIEKILFCFRLSTKT